MALGATAFTSHTFLIFAHFFSVHAFASLTGRLARDTKSMDTYGHIWTHLGAATSGISDCGVAGWKSGFM